MITPKHLQQHEHKTFNNICHACTSSTTCHKAVSSALLAIFSLHTFPLERRELAILTVLPTAHNIVVVIVNYYRTRPLPNDVFPFPYPFQHHVQNDTSLIKHNALAHLPIRLPSSNIQPSSHSYFQQQRIFRTHSAQFTGSYSPRFFS